MGTTSRPVWRTSTFSDNGGTCVEVAPEAGAVRVRDTKDRGPELVLYPDTFAALCAASVRREPVTGAVLTVVDDERVTTHAGRPVVTRWHVSGGGATLHFTDAEWRAFAAGVRAGEFVFAPA